MKKITMSVAALTIAMSSFGQCIMSHNDSIESVNYQENVQVFKEIDMRIDDIIDAIRMDMFYGRIMQENGMYYINEVLAIKSRNEDLVQELFKNNIQ
tara:strand:- start:116 stop:406 length:291 start_codon:yes stop_codon:yes gene_type:complete